jgi:hypothetical protein
MLKNTIILVIAVLCSLASMKSFADTAENCALIKDSNKRLACYDAIFLPLRSENQLAQKEPKPVESKTSAPSQSKQALFGAERLKKDDDLSPDQLSFVVSAISEDRQKIRTFTFTNNQVWREVTKTRLFVRVSDEVTIKKGAFTSYHLSKEGLNRKMQVKRIK